MVEIIPKPIEEVPLYQKILFYFSVFIFLATIISYFILSSFQKGSEITLSSIEESLAIGKPPRIITLEKEVLNYKRKIEDFSSLFQARVLPSKLFEFLESKTHPKVFFSQFNFNSNDSKITLAGETDNFSTLGQQISILKNEKLIKNVILLQVSISKEGKIKFALEVSFNPALIK